LLFDFDGDWLGRDDSIRRSSVIRASIADHSYPAGLFV
jgi:hypothetical protein